MAELILFNKPYRVLSQFTDSEGRNTLADFISKSGFYPAGRLDYDSEGLLLLCKDGRLQQRIADPRFKLWKRYAVQLEGEISDTALQALRDGVVLKDGATLPARASIISRPGFWPRNPPIRERRNQRTSWVEVAIREGRNRQLRRMCANVGFPVLRLIRTHIGDWTLDDLAPGSYRTTRVNLPAAAPKKRLIQKNRSRPRSR
ncbi:pseudouridine synthase [Congregibacter sp.]|uniref:pseudouridine synthase n=1 Tax=Congregibacter sp. TaxID=2744308 RepID=UPI003F6A69FC